MELEMQQSCPCSQLLKVSEYICCQMIFHHFNLVFIMDEWSTVVLIHQISCSWINWWSEWILLQKAGLSGYTLKCLKHCKLSIFWMFLDQQILSNIFSASYRLFIKLGPYFNRYKQRFRWNLWNSGNRLPIFIDTLAQKKLPSRL